jgi:hypothetical protein
LDQLEQISGLIGSASAKVAEGFKAVAQKNGLSVAKFRAWLADRRSRLREMVTIK